jgi:UDP-N-acetylglucosamine/UDP-N-acetyl-alpha-D-glucosaminouronate 4-epimerase
LIDKCERVRVFDNFSTGKRENLSAVGSKIEIIEGDIRDSSLCRQAMEGADYVIHLAALHEVPRSVEKPLETHEINVTDILVKSSTTIAYFH